MTRLIARVLATLLVSGFVTIQATPPDVVVAKLHVIAIVPIEAPPLLVHPQDDADRAALTAAGLSVPDHTGGASVFLPFTPNPAVNAASAIIGLLSLVGSSAPGKGDVLTLTKEQPAAWMPTRQLAQRAAELLTATGRHETFVVDGYARLPIVDRSVNNLLENWYAPVRQWYKSDVSMVDYGDQPALGDAVLEVGVSNFEYASQRFLMQVMVKLVDPGSRKVILRAREFSYPKGQSLAAMLQNQGEPLRELSARTLETLISKCLQDMALVPH